MIRNYFIIAYRNLLRNKTFSLINIFGLSLGMALSFMMSMYVYYELSFDDFHQHKDEIYRVLLKEENADGKSTITAEHTAAAGPDMLRQFPEIKNMTRISSPEAGFMTYDEATIKLNAISFADSGMFNIFSFQMLLGNPDKALTEPYSAVLTQQAAHKLFGEVNPLGKVVRFNNKQDYRVSGVVESPPGNSSIRFDALLSFSTLYSKKDVFLGWNGGYSYSTYLLLHKNVSIKNLQSGFPAFMEEKLNREYRDVGWFASLIIEPMKAVHLHSVAEYDLATKGSISQIYIGGGIALFILLIACINFINLSTARSIRRAKEVGIRKVVGATKKQLIGQFLSESMMLSIISLVFALLIIELIQPEFNRLLGVTMDVFQVNFMLLLLGLLLITLFVGLVSGSFPAFYMSGFKPVAILKGYFESMNGKPVLRNLLVSFQFFIVAVLMVCTLVILLQLRFLNQQDLGFDKKDVMLIELGSENSQKRVEALKNEFRKTSGVRQVAASTSFPGTGLTMNGYFPEGSQHSMMFHVMDVDFDYVDMMHFKIVKGRNFSRDFGTDSTTYLINETLARQLGWDNPIGKTIRRDGTHKIIGVVSDFNFSSLHNRIAPLIITLRPWKYYNFLSLKIQSGNRQQIMDNLEASWTKVVPGEPFDFQFLDSEINSNYELENRMAKAFSWLALLTIIIGCLGLYGQAAYRVSQQTREIGIRKVFGASAKNIFTVLSGHFTRMVILSNLIAWPVAWYFMHRWLENFAFHIPFYWWIFFLAFVLSLFITTGTILTQTLKASFTQPVDALKYE